MRTALIGSGLLVIAYAVIGAATDPDVKLPGVLAFLLGALVAHDAVFLPMVLAVGVLIGRYVPAEHRTAVRAAALVSAAVTLVALPLVLGLGRDPGNPSALPLPYGRGLAVLLALIWLTALAAVAVRRIRKRFARSRGTRDG
ncbi:MAG TPA: hypothetical protein VH502_00135 [Actinoplanes sp.]